MYRHRLTPSCGCFPASGLLCPAARCDVRLVRVDPGLDALPAAPAGTAVGLQCSALEALQKMFS